MISKKLQDKLRQMWISKKLQDKLRQMWITNQYKVSELPYYDGDTWTQLASSRVQFKTIAAECIYDY
jgi:hypothetical protein